MQAPPSAQALKAGKLVIPLSPRTILTGLYLAAGRKVGTITELCPTHLYVWVVVTLVTFGVTLGFALFFYKMMYGR